MGYSFRQNYRVRYDECNVFGLVTTAAILRYLQDIAAEDAVQAQFAGTGTWVARRTVIEFVEIIMARDRLELETYPLGFTKVTAQRGYTLRRVEGDEVKPVVHARTLWVYLDAKGRPTRLMPELLAAWITPGQPPLVQQAEAVWRPFPTRPAFSVTAPVRFSDLDVMGHMNNAAYVELLDNVAWQIFAQFGLLPDNAKSYPQPLHYDIEYIASAKAGDTLEIASWFEPLEDTNLSNCFVQLQQVRRDNVLLVRAQSHWHWQWQKDGPPFDVSQLWQTPKN